MSGGSVRCGAVSAGCMQVGAHYLKDLFDMFVAEPFKVRFTGPPVAAARERTCRRAHLQLPSRHPAACARVCACRFLLGGSTLHVCCVRAPGVPARTSSPLPLRWCGTHSGC